MKVIKLDNMKYKEQLGTKMHLFYTLKKTWGLHKNAGRLHTLKSVYSNQVN